MRKLLPLIFFILSLHCFADKYRMRVYFKDKQGYENIDITKFLSEKSIERRERQGIEIDYTDYPVNSSYLDELVKDGFKIVCQSKWLNSAVVESESDNSQIIASKDFVDSVKIVWYNKQATKSIKVSKPEKSNVEKESAESDKLTQLKMHNADLLHQQGYCGEGITIAVLDAGFLNVDKINSINSNVLGIKDFVEKDETEFYSQDSHGTNVLSILSFKNNGDFSGSAPDANYWLIRTEDAGSEFPVEEDYWVAGAEYADSVGVDIITSSLGYFNFDDSSMNYIQSDINGKTAFVTTGAGFAADKGILIFNSAGNEGSSKWGSICFPADNPKVITVGSVNSDSTYSVFSSKGFIREDGYVKPDLTSMGSNTWFCNGSGNLMRGNGTSYSTPVVCGIAACIWQAFPSLKPQEIKSLLLDNSSQYNSPDSLKGYGIPNVYKLYNDDNSVAACDNKIEYYYMSPNIWNIRVFAENEDKYPAYIISTSGKVVIKEDFKRGDNYLNLDSLYSGVYVICVQIDESRYPKLIVVE